MSNGASVFRWIPAVVTRQTRLSCNGFCIGAQGTLEGTGTGANLLQIRPRIGAAVTILASATLILLWMGCGIRGLLLHLDAPPEGDVVSNLGGRRAGVRIVPGGVHVLGAVHDQGIVVRLPLPAAERPGGALLEELAPRRVRRKIHV